MEKCNWKTKNECVSFHELRSQYEPIGLAIEGLQRQRAYRSTEEQYIAQQKLDDILNYDKVQGVCTRLGWEALTTCALHSPDCNLETEGIYLKPKTIQIYRRHQPICESDALKTAITGHTSTMSEEDILELNQLLQDTDEIEVELGPSLYTAKTKDTSLKAA